MFQVQDHHHRSRQSPLSFLQIEASGQIIKELNKELNQSEDLLRYLFIKVKEHQELPTKLNYEKK